MLRLNFTHPHVPTISRRRTLRPPGDLFEAKRLSPTLILRVSDVYCAFLYWSSMGPGPQEHQPLAPALTKRCTIGQSLVRLDVWTRNKALSSSLPQRRFQAVRSWTALKRRIAPGLLGAAWPSWPPMCNRLKPTETLPPTASPPLSILYIFTSVDGDHQPRACFKADAISFASCFILAPASRPLMLASGDLPSFFEEAPYRTGFKSIGASRCSSRAS